MGKAKRKSAEQKKREAKLRMQKKRASEDLQTKCTRLEKDRTEKVKSRKSETAQESEIRLKNVKTQMDKKRKSETAQESAIRLKNVRTQVERKRKSETAQESEIRLKNVKTQIEKKRKSETAQESAIRLKKVKTQVESKRKSETPQERQHRLDKDKLVKKRKFETETVGAKEKRLKQDRVSKKISRQIKKTIVPENDVVVDNFLENVKDAADYVCCSCNRLMYRITVVELHTDKYPKASKTLCTNVFAHRRVSAREKEWICRTCHLTLKKGKMPTQAKANNLALMKQPAQLKNLNPLELRLISQRIPFMKMVALPRGKQHGIHGPAVNVPAKLDAVCKLFPRLPSQSQLVPMKFKRSLKHASHYLYDFVDSDHVLDALNLLQTINPHYKNIEINENWAEDAEQDDPDLWEAISCSKKSLKYCGNNNLEKKMECDQTKAKDKSKRSANHTESTQINKMPKATSEPSSMENGANAVIFSVSAADENSDMGKLNNVAKQLDMNIVDAPGDGNCLFYSVCYQLDRLSVTTLTPSSLRVHLKEFMAGNAEFYRDFVCGLMESKDGCDADTERPTDMDRAIALIDDVESRKEVQWIKYLNELESGRQWGEHISLQAMADMFLLTVLVHTENGMTHTVQSRSQTKHEFHLGLIRQSHYVVFEPCTADDGNTIITDDTKSMFTVQYNTTNNEQENAGQTADKIKQISHKTVHKNDNECELPVSNVNHLICDKATCSNEQITMCKDMNSRLNGDNSPSHQNIITRSMTKSKKTSKTNDGYEKHNDQRTKNKSISQHHAISDVDNLKNIANNLGMKVVDVPGDGNCLFYSVCYQLKRLGITTLTPNRLRVHLSDFMAGHAEFYRDFVCGHMESNNLCNADTERPTDTDRAIALIGDVESRKVIQWIKYLNELESGRQWGEHISLQAMADMFLLKVFVHTTPNGTMHTVQSRSNTKHEFHLGLIRQTHYVVFDPCIVQDMDKDWRKKCTDKIDKDTLKKTELQSGALSKNTTNKNLSDATKDQISYVDEQSDDEASIEDKLALEEASKVCGLPYETSMIMENPDLAGKQISVAPAEAEKPRPLLSDKNFEELSNPDKYPDGSNALTADRPIEITPRKYFNQRLLDVDGRFAKSVEYLLSAQYAVESKQVQSDINHFVFRRAAGTHFHGNRINAGLTKNVEQMNLMINTDHAYKIMKNIRGTPAYFQTVFYDVLAMIRQQGIPTWFFTVSAADMQWSDLIQTIARQYGTTLTDDDVANLSFQERTMWLRTNPVTAARHFQYRLELLFRDVLKSKAHPLGEIVDYVIRVEFQARGSPHAHTLLWVKDAPKIDIQSDEEVCSFIDQHVTCDLPKDDSKLENLVKSLQTHSHSSYCRKKGSCRFKYPRPPSANTIIAREIVDNENEENTELEARKVLQKVHEMMTDNETPDDISLTELLEKADVEEQQYTDALAVSQKGTNVVLKRDPSQQCVNAYNPTILKAWQANLDIQYIIDAYACVMYVAAYLTKSEKGIGELLKQASREYKDKDIKGMLRRVGSVFLNHRELSAQEAVYRILSMPMKTFSRQVLFVNTDPKSQRAAVLKPKEEIEKLDDGDEDIFQKNIIIRYAARPNTLESMCLANFAANYTVDYADREDDDSAPQVLNENEEYETTDEERERFPKYIKLKEGIGSMRKRKREAVIRFRKFDCAKDASNFYRAKLMLYLPWRNEDRDLIGIYPDFASHYFAVVDQIRRNEAKFTENVELIDRAIHENAVHGPPEHMWANVAPGAEHANLQDANEGVEIERNIDQEDLEANAAMIEVPNCDHTSELIARYQAEADRELLQPAEYRNLIRGLNAKQRQIVMYHRQWCKNAVIAIKQKKPVDPYRIFLSGPGGVGKSHVIRLIHSDTKKLLSLSKTIKPTDVTVLLTAPTGVAAFNIGGMTVHSALLLRTSKYGKTNDPLSFEKLNTLRSKLDNLQLVIIDEVSMIGSDMLLSIHKRLDEIKGQRLQSPLFGNVCILAVGDLYQLPPVMQSNIYDPVRDPVERLNGSLWKDHFQLHELDEIMRQKEDSSFADLLCRVRVGSCTEQDIEVLRSRQITPDDPNYPDDALHVYAFNYNVDQRNEAKLKILAPRSEQRISIHASDDKTDSTGQVDLQTTGVTKKRSETAGLHTVLVLAVGARVMLTYNVDTSDGLVNGVIGTVVAIIKNNNDRVLTIIVKFDNDNVGKKAIALSQWKHKFPSGVPIMRHEGKYDKTGRKGAQISRRQFPLTLAWAVTIHKCQGLTVDKIVVNMKGAKRFGKGQAYVAFSRVKTLQGLYIVEFDPAGIKVNAKIQLEMNEMSQNMLPPIKHPNFVQLPKPQWTTIGHLNIRYFLEKLHDLHSDPESKLLSATDVMCFTETYLTNSHNIDKFLKVYDYKCYRQDVPSEQNHGGKHGVMICASAKLNPIELDTIEVQGLESKVVVLTGQRSRFVVAVVYRKPSLPKRQFLDKLETLLTLMALDVPTFVLGDFNDDLVHEVNSQFTTLMDQYGFKQCVTNPTTDNGTLLDHIYFNKYNDVDSSDIIVDVHDVYFSDHDSVFLTTKCL